MIVHRAFRHSYRMWIDSIRRLGCAPETYAQIRHRHHYEHLQRFGDRTYAFEAHKKIVGISLPTICKWHGIREGHCKLLKEMAPQVGLEPTTLRLTAGCSAIELLRSVDTTCGK